MRLFPKHFAFFIVLVLIVACEGPAGPNGKDGVDGKDGTNGTDGSNGQDGAYDKQIRIYFPFETWGTNSTAWEFPEPWCYLTKFNKLSFTHVDSIVFTTYLYLDRTNTTISDTAFAELYNVTDNHAIEGTLFTSINGSFGIHQTGNLYNSLPGKEITLGVRMKVKNPNNFCIVASPQLFLYRK